MTLPTTGPISLNNVSTEIGIGVGSRLDFNDGRVRALAGRPSGAISMADLRGKSSYVPMTLVMHSNETGNTDPMEWYPTSNPGQSYFYNCGITAVVTNGVGPFTYQFTKSNSVGTFTYDSSMGYATWRITVARFSPPGVIASADFTCVVTDSTGRQISLTTPGIVEAT